MLTDLSINTVIKFFETNFNRRCAVCEGIHNDRKCLKFIASGDNIHMTLQAREGRLLIVSASEELFTKDLEDSLFSCFKSVCEQSSLFDIAFPLVGSEYIRSFCKKNNFVEFDEPSKYSFLYNPISYILYI